MSRKSAEHMPGGESIRGFLCPTATDRQHFINAIAKKDYETIQMLFTKFSQCRSHLFLRDPKGAHAIARVLELRDVEMLQFLISMNQKNFEYLETTSIDGTNAIVSLCRKFGNESLLDILRLQVGHALTLIIETSTNDTCVTAAIKHRQMQYINLLLPVLEEHYESTGKQYLIGWKEDEKSPKVGILHTFLQSEAEHWETNENENPEYLTQIINSKSFSKIEVDAQKNTLLHDAIKYGLPQHAELLIKAGLSPWMTNEKAETPLHQAVECKQKRQVSVVQTLLKHHAPLLARDYRGNTPLHHFAMKDHVEIVKLILGKDTSLLVEKNKENQTVFDVAGPSVQKLLESYPPLAKEGEGTFKIQFASDLHVEFGGVNAETIVPNADYLLLVGDIGVATDLEYERFLYSIAEKFKMVFVVLGNHEFYGSEFFEAIEKVKSICDGHPKITFLEHGSADIDGYRILGCCLWSHVPTQVSSVIEQNINDYRMIKVQQDNCLQPLTADFINARHTESVKWLKGEITKAKQQNVPVIIATHYSPVMGHGCSNPVFWQRDTRYGFSTDLTELMDPIVKYWIYGHTHYYHDMVYNKTRIISNPRGYPHINDVKHFDPLFAITL